jgi:S1-C subfamily serine protease
MRRIRLHRALMAGLVSLLAVALMITLWPVGITVAQDGERPFIGIEFEQRVDSAYIVRVVSDSPAADAGLMRNDAITAIDDNPITADTPLVAVMEDYAPGDVIMLTVLRDDEAIEIELTLGVAPDVFPEAEDDEDGPAPEDLPLLQYITVDGVRFVNAGDAGWIVVDVPAGSPASEAGLQVNDAIMAIDGEPMSDVDTGVLATHVTRGGEFELTVDRGGEMLTITLPVEAGTAFGITTQRGMIPAPTVSVPPSDAPDAPTQPMPPVMQEEPRGFLGVNYLTLTPDIDLDALGIEWEVEPLVTSGGLVAAVEPGTPAAESGLVAGDVIVAVGGDVVDEERTLGDRIYAYEADDTITLTVARGEDVLEVEVTLIVRPPALDMPQGGIMITPEEMERFLEENPQFGTLFGNLPPLPFIDPDFDWEGYLEANPDLLQELEEGNVMRFPFFMQSPFTNPDFDWNAFLEDNPRVESFMRDLSERLTPEQLEALFPNFPWFSEADPFHQDVDPLDVPEDDTPA